MLVRISKTIVYFKELQNTKLTGKNIEITKAKTEVKDSETLKGKVVETFTQNGKKRITTNEETISL